MFENYELYLPALQAWTNSAYPDQTSLISVFPVCFSDKHFVNSSPDNQHLSIDMTFPTIWIVQPAKAQTSLHIRAVWSEPLLVTWII